MAASLPEGWVVRPATPSDFAAVLALQRSQLRGVLDDHGEGFLTVSHTPEQLSTLNSPVPHTVAFGEGNLLGYALGMSLEHRDLIPVLEPLFTQLDRHTWRGRRIAELDYTVVGQVCVAPATRGRGVFRALYAAWCRAQAERFALGVTEIDASNVRSLAAHAAIGFEEIGRHRQGGQQWVLVGRELAPDTRAFDP